MALAALIASPALAETFAGPFPVRVVRVIDGDTVLVAVRLWFAQTLTERIRIAGIDAPERGKGAKCTAEAEAVKSRAIVTP